MTANSHDPGPASAETGGPTTGRIPADTLANRLILARKLAGMSQEDAAAAAGRTQSSWANWENGMRPQGEIDVCRDIAAALDVDYNWLANGGPLTPSAPTRRVTKRTGTDTLRYPAVPVRSTSSVRPRGGRPPGRSDTGPRPTQPPRPVRERSVRISGPIAA